MGKPQRVSMKGMGAEAFFSPPVEVQEERQQTSTPASQDTSAPVHHQASREGYQYSSQVPLHQDTSTEVIEGITSTPVQRDTSKPAQKQASKLIKASYYISEEDDLLLEHIRLKRRRKGQKVDKSALIREAIRLLQE